MAYFETVVKPLIKASDQHAAAFDSGDVIFDWCRRNI